MSIKINIEHLSYKELQEIPSEYIREVTFDSLYTNTCNVSLEFNSLIEAIVCLTNIDNSSFI